MNNLAEFLSKIEPFRRLPPEEIRHLSLICQVVHHHKGDILFNEGDSAANIWILQEGRLAICIYGANGRPMVFEWIQPGQLFGTLCRLSVSMKTTYPCTAVAAVDSVSIRIPDHYFQSLYHRFPAMAGSLCELCSPRLASVQQRTVALREPVRTRIVRTLLELRKVNGDQLPYTKREIAELAGTTVETTFRVLSVLRRNRWLRSQRGKIQLKDIAHLEMLLP